MACVDVCPGKYRVTQDVFRIYLWNSINSWCFTTITYDATHRIQWTRLPKHFIYSKLYNTIHRCDSESAVLKNRSTQKPQYSKIHTFEILATFQRLLQLPQRFHKLFEGWFGQFRQLSFSGTKNYFHNSHILPVINEKWCGSVSYL